MSGLAEESDVTIISEVSLTMSAAIEIRLSTSVMLILISFHRFYV